MNESRNPLKEQSRHNLPSSQEPKLQLVTSSPSPRSHLSLKNPAISDHSAPKASHPFSPDEHFKENLLGSFQGPQNNISKSEQKDIQENLNMGVALMEKKASEKSYRDLNRSLANLGRANDSSSSIDDILGRHGQTGKIHLGPKLLNFQFQPFYNPSHKSSQVSGSKGSLLTSKTPTSKDYKDGLSFTLVPPENGKNDNLKKGKAMHGRSGVSNVEYGRNERLREKMTMDNFRSCSNSNLQKKNLLTEGDSPIGSKDFFENNLPKGLVESSEGREEYKDKGSRVPKKSKFEDLEQKFGELHNYTEEEEDRYLQTNKESLPGKLNSHTHDSLLDLTPSFRSKMEVRDSAFSRHVYATLDNLQTKKEVIVLDNLEESENYENYEVLDQNLISEGVEYKKGGVGYGQNGRKIKGREEMIIAKSAHKVQIGENKKLSRRKCLSVEKEQKLAGVPKEALDSLKNDILNIKKDMEKRKHSYERVNSFLQKCEPEKLLLPNFGTDETQDNNGYFPLHFFSPHSQQTQPTLHTLPTQPERVISPSFSPLNNIHPFSYSSNPNEALSNGERSNERQKETRTFYDEDDDERILEEGHVAKLHHSRFKTLPDLPDYRNQREPREVILGSFISPNMGCAVACRSPCCSTTDSNSMCQLF